MFSQEVLEANSYVKGLRFASLGAVESVRKGLLKMYGKNGHSVLTYAVLVHDIRLLNALRCELVTK